MTFLTFASSLIFFVLLSAFFSGCETALTSLNRIALRHRAEGGDRNAQRLLKILENPDRMLITTLVGTNLATVCAAALFSNFMVFQKSPSPEAMTVLLLTPLLLIFGEIIPKALFRQRALFLMQELSGILELSFKFLAPVSKLLEGLNRLLLFCLRQEVKMSQLRLPVTKAELKYLVQESEREGTLKAPERSLIYQIFDLGEKKMGELMAPLPQGPLPREDDTIADFLAYARTSGLSRIPVVKADSSFAGFVNLFDVAYEETCSKPIKPFLRPLHFVPESMAVDETLLALQERKIQIVIVTDEAGRPKGMAMLEELVSELIGPAVA